MISVPVILEMDYLLKLWLGDVPNYAAPFAQLTLVSQLINVISIPLITAMLASGKIRNYQIIVGGLGLAVFFISWLLFHLGCGPETPYIVIIVIFIIQLATRLYLLIDLVKLDAKHFVTNVLMRCATVCVIVCSASIIVCKNMDTGFVRVLMVGLTSVATTLLGVYYIGVNNHEREYLIEELKSKISKRK